MRKDKYLLKLIAFTFLLAFNTSVGFHVFGDEIIGSDSDMAKPPAWCPPPEHPGLSSICGTVRGALLEPDDRGEFMPNLEKEGVTVSVWEENPLAPTGKIEGKLTNLFSSTSTNELGRYHVTARKVTPPNVKVHVVFVCNGAIVAHQILESWHDYWEINQQVSCPTSDYIAPTVPLSYIDRSQFLGCTNKPDDTTYVGMLKAEQPTVNTYLREDNYDHRYGINSFNVDLGISILGWTAPNFVFESKGGEWEPDCLLEANQYVCNVDPGSCRWDDPNLGGSGQQQLGDGVLCNGDGSGPMAYEDFITSGFFKTLPQEDSALPYRREDIRAGLENASMDVLAPMQWTGSNFGSSYADPVLGPYAFFRKFLEEPDDDKLPSCKIFADRNNAYEIRDFPSRNFQLNSGPFGGLLPPDDTAQKIYYAQIRDLSTEICLNDSGVAIKLCEIQPPWSPVGLCKVGEPGCMDPNTGCVFKEPKSRFPTDAIFEAGQSDTSFLAQVQNDSMYNNSPDGRPTQYVAFDTESQVPHRTGSKAILDGGGEKIQSSSMATVASISNVELMVPGAKSVTDPLTIPFGDNKIDYIDKKDWSIWDVGTNPKVLCSLGNPFNYTVTGPVEEANPDFHPDNSFEGNPHQIAHRAAGTGTWYFGEESIDRDGILKERGITFPYSDVTDSLIVNTGLSHVIGREVFDSLLTLMGGDTKVHDFNISFANIANVAVDTITDSTITQESNVKTFGDRDPSLAFPIGKPYYSVSYPLSDTSFTQWFSLPEYTGAPGELAPDDWGNPGNECYPFENVPEGEKCNTYREDPAGISRTCKVEACWQFWQVEVGTCTCNGPNGPCELDDIHWELRNADCNADTAPDKSAQRRTCAYEQETTVRVDTDPNSEDDQPVPEEILEGHSNYNDDYNPPEIDPDKCNPGIFNWGPGWGGNAKDKEIEGGDGDSKLRCDMEVAGPLLGGAMCNGSLLVDDPAFRMIQQPQTGQTQQNLDDSVVEAYKVTTALRPPYLPDMGGPKLMTLDSRLSNDPTQDENGFPAGVYTYGAEVEVGGYSDVATKALSATPPTFPGPRNTELEDLFYHCNFDGTYSVGERGIQLPDFGYGYDPEFDGTIGWLCPVYDVPSPEIPELTETIGACGVSNQSSCIATIQAFGGLNKGLSQTGFNVINKAANQMGTPAGALMAVLLLEGGFSSSYDDYWSNDTSVFNWSVPWYGRFDRGGPAQCNENVWSAQGPFQILQSTWKSFIRLDDVCSSLNSIAYGRCISASRCNILDSAIVAAEHLNQNSCGAGYDIIGALNSYSGGSRTADEYIIGQAVFSACK